MRFTSFYGASVCAPSRAQLMTGCYSTRVGMARNPFPNSDFGLHPNEQTIAELVRSSGYATLCIGKWHLGDAPEFLPTRQGFDAYFGVPFSNDMWRFHPKMPPRENEEPLMKQMRERAAYTGFHLSGSYYPPGMLENDLPLMRGESVSRTIPTSASSPRATPRPRCSSSSSRGESRSSSISRTTCRTCRCSSRQVRRQIAARALRRCRDGTRLERRPDSRRVKQLGLDERTLVIFTSDNGPWLHYGIDGGPPGLLRDGKIHVGGRRPRAAIARWPGRFPPAAAPMPSRAISISFPPLRRLAGAHPRRIA
jgi:hypothetical protein